MFYVNDELRFWFQHDVKVSEKGTPYGSTSCFVEEKRNDEWHVLRFGKARCSEEDMFHKPTGRKIALNRAIYGVDGNSGLKDKELRTAIWNTYFSNVSDLK